MAISNQLRIIFLWLILAACMDLHYDFHVSDNFCGISNNIVSAYNELSPPPKIILLKVILDILPLCFAAMVLFVDEDMVRKTNLALAVIYTLFHIAHLLGQISQDPPIILQLVLLSAVAGFSIGLCAVSYLWMKENAPSQ